MTQGVKVVIIVVKRLRRACVLTIAPDTENRLYRPYDAARRSSVRASLARRGQRSYIQDQ